MGIVTPHRYAAGRQKNCKCGSFRSTRLISGRVFLQSPCLKKYCTVEIYHGHFDENGEPNFCLVMALKTGTMDLSAAQNLKKEFS